ncbi:MAG: HAD-IG family 5'-nucleotidase [Myxococcaceae bacterium]|nr:HAD-IG family 5'-nucleotidase [Myxococcaceae bacterium]MBH2006208.1 HAD-IG family 5'-nucleotidase [Myxococcaceae bacterium]
MSSSYFSPISPSILQHIRDPQSLVRDPSQEIYTNRSLDLSSIEAIGFDMDYTLVNYHKKPMEQLQYEMTLEYLVKTLGYPADLYQLQYDPNLSIRGLVVDKRYGLLLKMDMHGQVWRAKHGYRALASEEIKDLYQNHKIKITSDFASLDTLFAMPEASLYCDLVHFFRHQSPNFAQIFEDIRHSIDTIHSNGSLKSIIRKDLPRFIETHNDIALTLHKLRSSGKKLFLLTNSHFDYTETVMSYLLGNWMPYFDYVITDSRKPAFFTEGAPFKKISEKSSHPIYEGGNIAEFEEMAGLVGGKVLYVGDHIYGDIVRSRKETLWRTCLIVEELPREIELSMRFTPELDQLRQIDQERITLDKEIGLHRALLAYLDSTGLQAEAVRLRNEMEAAKKHLGSLDRKMDLVQDDLERRFHPFWGELFYEHHDLSRFGSQVKAYACIYTSRITNFLPYSPMHHFRKRAELMSHDLPFRF